VRRQRSVGSDVMLLELFKRTKPVNHSVNSDDIVFQNHLTFCSINIANLQCSSVRVNSNKLWHDVQNEVTLIYAKFGKDLLNISKIMGYKTKWPRFWPTLYIRASVGAITALTFHTLKQITIKESSDVGRTRCIARFPCNS